MSIQVRPIRGEELDKAKEWITKKHYLGRWSRSVQEVLGVYSDNTLVGTVVYGIGTRAQSTREIFQNDDGSPIMQNNQMWELQRLYLTPEAQNSIDNLASQAIARSNEYIRTQSKTKDGKPIHAVISYADTGVGHAGSVYKATNALYLGAQKPLPYYVVTDPKTGKVGRRSKLTQVQQSELRKRGYEIKREMPEEGKHKFLYPLGKKQKDRDKLTSYIVKPLYSYPDEQNPGGKPIPNPAKEKKQDQPQKSSDQGNDQRGNMDQILNTRIPNPETGNQILVKTALGYEKNHPMYQRAVQIIKNYQRSL